MSGGAFDWPTLLRAGCQGLGLTPDEFWALTPAELRLLLGRDDEASPLDRGALDALVRDFPDIRSEQ